jgi:hypothetical protein
MRLELFLIKLSVFNFAEECIVAEI